MFLIFTSRKRPQPLHIVSLGSSGTGKTHLQEKVGELIPEEDRIEITTLSENDERSNRNWFPAYRLSKKRNKTILSLLLNQGITTPEVERLSLSDLKLKEGTIYISGSRKSNERTLELKSNQIIELMEY